MLILITSIAAWIENSLRRWNKHNYRYDYLNLSFFLLEIFYFLLTKLFFRIKTEYVLIDFDVIILMQSSEFTKSLN